MSMLSMKKPRPTDHLNCVMEEAAGRLHVALILMEHLAEHRRDFCDDDQTKGYADLIAQDIVKDVADVVSKRLRREGLIA